MASVPPRRASQRRSSPSAAESSQAQLPRTNSEAVSTISEDSQPVFLNSPTEKRNEEHADEEIQTERPASASASNQGQQDEQEVRKCWICFSDETEDDPMSSEWRSPCPCALVAHEACLLDWIADMEAPTSRQRTGSSREVKCPQCKAEIHLSQPRSLVVDAVRKADDLAGDLIIPWGAVIVSETLHSASFVHGAATIFAIFGAEDSKRIFQPFAEAINTWSLQGTLKLFREHWRLNIGIPLIPSILILSRTSFADNILPIIPVIFIATSVRSEDVLSRSWPPSAAMAFGMLPYLRSAYNTYYELAWGKLERQWLKQVLPRNGRSEDEANNGDGEVPVDDDEGVLQIDVDIVEEWEENEAVHREHQRQQQEGQDPEQEHIPEGAGTPPLDARPPDQRDPAAMADAVAADDAAPAQGEGNVRRQERERRWVLPTSRILDTLLGALAFPGIAAAMGEMLRLTLPRSLTTFAPGRNGKATGLLQARWGRSIVGGCMFVVLKDAVLLYVRWRMAQNHKQRKVRNYDKVLKKVVEDPEHSRPVF